MGKTYKHRYEELLIDYEKFKQAYNTLYEELYKINMSKLENLDTNFINCLVNNLEDIRKNGGEYSKAKAVEILFMLGRL